MNTCVSLQQVMHISWLGFPPVKSTHKTESRGQTRGPKNVSKPGLYLYM